jgi:hypothetical protein
MTKLITAVIIALFLFGGWHLFLYWERVKNEEEATRKEAAAALVAGNQLPGLPFQLEESLQKAQQSAEGMRNWLKAYGAAVQDPRKAWIELDYVLLVSRENPAEAKRVFAEVRDRTPASSPVHRRIKELEKTYQ